MNKLFTVAKWEYLERIKNKSYIFMTFFFPLIIFGLALLPALLEREEDLSTKVIGVVLKNIDIYDDLEKSLLDYKTKDGQPTYILRNINSGIDDPNKILETGTKLIKEKAIEGYLYIEKVSSDSFLVEFYTEKFASIKDIARFEKVINQVLINEKLKLIDLEPDKIKGLTRSVSLKLVKLSEKGKEKFETEKVFLGTFFFILFLMFSLIMSAGLLVRSVVEEKSNRIIEILLSSCTTNELMAGKILGLSALGLTQILVWIVIAISAGGPVILNYIQVQDFGLSLIYFILGYLFYASLFIGIGSIANNEQESQTIMSLLSVLIMMPIFLSSLIFENPESTIGTYLSYFPLTTAPMMTMRINLIEVSSIEKLITLLILILSIFGSIWFSGKIFRVAILSYGKIPNIADILKWLKS